MAWGNCAAGSRGFGLTGAMALLTHIWLFPHLFFHSAGDTNAYGMTPMTVVKCGSLLKDILESDTPWMTSAVLILVKTGKSAYLYVYWNVSALVRGVSWKTLGALVLRVTKGAPKKEKIGKERKREKESSVREKEKYKKGARMKKRWTRMKKR